MKMPGMDETLHLDAFDLRILACLQGDARLTNQELSETVGLSASQCSRRRMRHEELGLIRGYHAALDPAQLGFVLLAFIQVTLSTHNKNNSRRFRELVAGIDSIQEAHALTGDADYLLKVALRDLKELADLVNDRLLAHESIAHVRSSIVFERIKEASHLPINVPKRASRGR
jgi:DNA-binding Lrp family transcriptional regulator